MNVMAFDIFQRFWIAHLRSRNDPSISVKEKKKLALYILYAMGTPLVITAITAILQFSDQIADESNFKPQFGLKNCFFDEDKKLANFVLFYLPLLLIQIANLAFFSLTVFKLAQTWRESGRLRMHNNDNHSNASVVMKVFLVMGINWLFEFLSFWATWAWDEEIATNISYFNDMVNLLQGLLIFVVLVSISLFPSFSNSSKKLDSFAI